MGNHMARNLLKKGYPLMVYDVNKEAVEGLKQAGIQIVFIMCISTVESA